MSDEYDRRFHVTQVFGRREGAQKRSPEVIDIKDIALLLRVDGVVPETPDADICEIRVFREPSFWPEVDI